MCIALSAALLVGLCSCGGDFDYTMKNYKTEALSYSIPEHFELIAHEEADAFYTTLNSSVMVYSYSHSQLDDAFENYSGDYTARSFAEFLVDMHEYNCIVYDGDIDGSVAYSFMYTDAEQSYYYTSIVLADEENVCMLIFSCLSDKLEMYQDMIRDILASPRIEK